MTSPVRPDGPVSTEQVNVNILLVDDEGRNLDVLESILAAPGYHLVRVQTAQEALMALIDGEFAVIVLDIQMPGTSGIELAHLIKQRKKTQHIPIIFLTAYYHEDKDILHGYQVGAVDYLTKPVDPRILRSKIAVFIELFQKTRQLTALNSAMENEIAHRQEAEAALRQVNNELEARVQERIAAHAELAGQKEIQSRLFDATLSSINDLAYTFDLEGNWIYANKALLELWGKSLEEITGKSSLELGYPADLAERLKRQVKEVIATRKAVQGETYYTSAAGVEDYHEYIFSPVFASNGSVTAVCGTTRLTTERKRTEAALRESEQRYRQLISSLPAAVYTTDAQGRVTLYNEAAVALWGRKPEIGKELWCGCYRIFRPDGTPMSMDQSPMAVTLCEGRAVRGEEFSIERPDGARRNVLPYPDLIRDASGKIVGAVNMLLDITESKRTEEASRRLAAIVESSDDAIISKDLNGIITSWNHSAERLFGYSAAEAIGKPIAILLPPDRSEEEVGILQRIRQGERLTHYETVRQRKDGKLIEISLTISPVKDANGRVFGASKIARDITKQKRAKRELEQAHAEILAASRAKDDFLAALSHELRTPLNPVLLLASEAAEDPQLPADVRAQFTTIRTSIELEARLIDDLLDLTSITHGKLSLNLDLVDVHTLLKEALVTVQSELDQKRIALTMRLEAERSVVKGDAVRLQQVFWNVLKNAVKFTPNDGSVAIITHTLVKTGEMIITVEDSGIGMLKEEQMQIFEAFAQGEHAHGGGAHRFGGLGLGLAISRMLVESHAGRIDARSEGRNRGSTFTITLPLAVESAVIIKSPKDVPARTRLSSGERSDKISILLVEDHEPTRTALTHLLTRRHYAVKAAATAAEARDLSERQKFDLIISDIGLPDGCGFQLMKELRARNAELRGIALTGYGMEEDVARSRDAGFTSHLTKPIRMQSLEAALAATISD